MFVVHVRVNEFGPQKLIQKKSRVPLGCDPAVKEAEAGALGSLAQSVNSRVSERPCLRKENVKVRCQEVSGRHELDCCPSHSCIFTCMCTCMRVHTHMHAHIYTEGKKK